METFRSRKVQEQCLGDLHRWGLAGLCSSLVELHLQGPGLRFKNLDSLTPSCRTQPATSSTLFQTDGPAFRTFALSLTSKRSYISLHL